MNKNLFILMLILCLSVLSFSDEITTVLKDYTRYSDTLDYLSEQAFNIEDQSSPEYAEIYFSAHFVKDKLENKTNLIKNEIEKNPTKTITLFEKVSSTRNSNINKFKDLINYNIEILKDSGKIEYYDKIKKLEYQLNTPYRSITRTLPDMDVMDEIANEFDSDEYSSRSVDSSDGLWRIVMTGKNKTTPFLVQSDSFLKAGEIILTFDDGPTTINNRTASVTEVLNSFGYESIFFVLGKSITSNTSSLLLAQKKLADVSVHGMHHATPSGSPFTAMSRDEILSDLTKVKNKINSITNKTPHFFRPPYGVIRKSDLDAIMDKLNLIPVGWTIDSLDWSTKNPDELFQKMKSLISKRGKGILLMHDIHEQSALSFARLAEWLKDNNYKIVSPSRLIEAYSKTQGNNIIPVKPSIPSLDQAGKYIYITTKYANIRTGPGKEYSIITALEENTKLRVIEEIDGWFKVEAVNHNITGYISGNIVSSQKN
ncbi:MAG: polysaccharide deacetylase family protein [Candidatus Muirbacterium halophilum]|nr:polysaccharide deacetylase family protein [Candidatus Muirbacterium halophilum]MCK9477218.1 polysaccharide deacetylase family protein [Candidatus Muirbacterium halophilum]